MRLPPPPLRFLLLVVGGWACLRGAYVATQPGQLPTTGQSPPPLFAEAAPRPERVDPQLFRPEAAPDVPRRPFAAAPFPERYAFVSRLQPVPIRLVEVVLATPPPPRAAPVQADALPSPLIPEPLLIRSPIASRWSASGWVHLRRAGSPGLAPGGTLGGSQAGARLTYRLVDGLALSARLYSPLGRPQGAEAAIGVDWQPLSRLPIHLLAERRQRIGREGRSDFALTTYGGVSDRLLPGGLRLDVYGQAGVVGLRSRDLFADGAARIGTRIGPVDVGGGAWGAAQPGVSRLDIGPQASVRLPLAGASVRVSADWRFRIAGNAAPSSGPSLTVGTDF